MAHLRRKVLEALATATSLLCIAAVPALAQSVTVTVRGQANPYLAGMPDGSTCCADEGGVDTAGPQLQSPVLVTGITPGLIMTFATTGSVSNQAGQPPTDPPDGSIFFDLGGVPGTPSSNGIASVNAPLNSLVGVFLNDSQPNTSGAPPGLNFSPQGLGTGFTTLSPALKQVFFIGDGRTGTGTGAIQQFVVPTGATRLFLGTVDGIGWHTNSGNFTVQINGGGPSGGLAAAVLPLSRSVQVGNPATAFATIINATGAPATGCAIGLVTQLPLSNFLYQTTSAATNTLIGTANTPANIPAGGSQSFLISLTPSGTFGSTDVAFNFQCSSVAPAPVISGVNTLLLTAAGGPVPDVIALAATQGNTGIVNLVGGSGAFAVATANVGASALITATVDTGSASLPIALSICQTGAGGACVAPAGSSATVQINNGATPTFGVFASGGPVPFNPAVNRIFVRFRDGGGVVRGATSVAVRTQ